MELLERHFDTAFDAPDGIKKLRELILTLAMQGKLVPQNPKDQPASELLKEIEAEKKRLVKLGKIKDPKPLPPVNSEEMPYALPKGWEWVKLGNAMLKITDGTHHSPPNCDRGDFLYISAKNIKDEGVLLSNATYVTRDVHDEIYSRCNPEYGNILYIKDGATTGIVTINNLHEPFSMLSSVALLKQPQKVNNRYLFFVLKAPFFYEAMRSGMAGIAITRVTLNKLQEAVIPLAPYSEQSRIVAKIDELMARCDALEKLRAERDAKQLAVHKAAVRQLLNVADTDGHIQAREFLGQHFGELYTVKENVTELRKAILQLAVMGKLVPQDPNDPPASELLKQIETEKKKLVKDGKLREAKNLVTAVNGVHGGALPEGWVCTQLQSLVAIVTDGDHQPPPKADRGVPFLVIGNLNRMTIDLADCRFVTREYYDALDWTRRPKRRDVLYTVTGSYGIPIVVDRDEEFCVQRHVAIFKSTPSTPVDYLAWVLKSEGSLRYATAIATGIAQKTVPLTGLRAMPIPLPPLAEQRRIVAKIGQLMSMCDTLERQIDAAGETQSALLNAMMAQYGGQRCA